MAVDSEKARSIFTDAVENHASNQWGKFLDDACGKDLALRKRVETLLKAHQGEDNLLDRGDANFSPTYIRPVTEQPGDRIGPFKLLQHIGEGGFGVVYMAEQTKPVRRKVALKIIKPGMDTKEVIARFEAELQALALMDHPNIAKVLDAGSTESGRPYFVMELVKGVPLTEYCDKNHLSSTERLKLFVQVCHAVQHAHQKGVIHRDLKPSNIMITLHDGKPVPKVIDFGVSKALSQQLTEKTLFTAYGQMVGTPAYMSPEQAEMSGLDIDTRSDVYSLGVLLYELLTGNTPFDKKRLRSAGYAEMQRIIREEEPVKPSTKLTTLGEMASIVSSNRGTDTKKLRQLVCGDLDWIVMKALDKERNRRYETANGFASDIERFLEDEPVEACPPTVGYKFKKFARRNRPLITTTCAIVAALVIGAGLALWQAYRATNARNLAILAEAAADEQAEHARKEAEIAEAVNEFLNKDLLARADPHMMPVSDVTVRTLLDNASNKLAGRFEQMPLVKAAIHQTLGETYQNLGIYDKAERHSRRAFEIRRSVLGEEDSDTLESMLRLAEGCRRTGKITESQKLCREVIQISERAFGGEWHETSHAYNLLGHFRLPETEKFYRKAVELSERESGKKDIIMMCDLALVIRDRDEKMQVLREALRIARQEYDEDHPYISIIKWMLGYTMGPENEEATQLLREALMGQEVLAPNHPYRLKSRRYLSFVEAEQLRAKGEFETAIEKYSEAIRARSPGIWAPPNQHELYLLRSKAHAALGQWDLAKADCLRVLEQQPQQLRHIFSIFGKHQRWREAAEFGQLLIDQNLEQFDSQFWLEIAIYLAISGDRDGYRKHCERMLQRYQESETLADQQRTSKACLLLPNVIDPTTIPMKNVNISLDQDAPVPLFLAGAWTTRALQSYRLGETSLAIEYIKKSNSLNSRGPQLVSNQSILAMVYHQLDRADSAKETLENTQNLIRSLSNTTQSFDKLNILIAEILFDEAEMLIEGKPLKDSKQSK